ELFGRFAVETVPVLYRGPFAPATVEAFCGGPTAVCDPARAGKHSFREGIVITPVRERTYDNKGTPARLVLKAINPDYLMRKDGMHNVDVLRTGDSLPYSYGEWLGAPGKPTVFLYAHHDVQPVNKVGDPKDDWKSDPWTLTRREGRLFGRGSADDKGAIVAQLGAVSSYLKTRNALPVNIKMLVEGEEEVGSRNLMRFFEQHKKRI